MQNVKLRTICLLPLLWLATGAAGQEPKSASSCSGLTLELKADIDRMRKLQDRAEKEEKAPPADLLSAWQRTFGKKGDGIPSLTELRKIRQRADGLNTSLGAQGCATIDIDQELMRMGR
jgi:hypothetical protein